MKTRTSSSKVNKAWLHDHINDPYVKLAQREGYRARAAYKLKEIDEAFGLVRPGQFVVDLGCAPGAWSQYLRRRLAPGGAAAGALDGTIVGLDVLPMDPIEGVHFIQGDFREADVLAQLQAALAGRLVLSTLHTNSEASSINRLVDVFEPAEKAWVQSQLSTSLLGIASQVLLRRAKAPGRVAAFEVLRATPAIGQMIREQKISQIAHALQTGARWGMHSMAQDLQRLAAAGLIDAAQAQSHLGPNHPGP
jgi:23S rRNA U2552 (ribose-2'-O)-methylase RlmE/FtsJ